MEIEYEATFLNIDKDEIREKLKGTEAKLIKSEFLQKRIVFDLPKGHEVPGAWARVRDEGDKITMSLKVVEKREERKIENQKEICLVVNSFDEAEKFLAVSGFEKKAYQETKREIWVLNEVEICIDEWPFLEPFVEIEGENEEKVKKVSEKLGFNYKDAHFCSAGTLYSMKYDVSEKVINTETPRIVFDEENPFVK